MSQVGSLRDEPVLSVSTDEAEDASVLELGTETDSQTLQQVSAYEAAVNEIHDRMYEHDGDT